VLSKTDAEIQGTVGSMLCLAGGNCLVRGFKERLQYDLGTGRLPKGHQVVSPQGGQHSAWTGGAILSSSTAFLGLLVTRKELAEHGAAQVLEKKCQ